MSVEAYNAVWKYFEGTQRQRVIMLALANRADEHGVVFEGIEALQQKARMKRSTVFEVLREIEASGQLVTLEGGGGRGLRSLRWLKLEGLDGDTSEAERRIRKGPKTRTGSGNKKGPNLRTVEDPKGSEDSDQAQKQRVRTPGQKGSELSDSLSIGDTSVDTSNTPCSPPHDTPEGIADFWKRMMGVASGIKPAAKGLKAAAARLRDNHPPSELRRAIVGCERSDFHMKRGRYANRDGPRHNKLALIMRDADQVRMFAELAPAGDPLNLDSPASAGKSITPSADAQTAWAKAQSLLRRSTPDSTYQLWLKHPQAYGERGSTLVLSAAANQAAWISRRYTSLILQAVNKVPEGEHYSAVEVIDGVGLGGEAAAA